MNPRIKAVPARWRSQFAMISSDRPNQGFHYECVGLLLTQCPVQGGSRYRQNKLSDFSPRNGSWL